MLGVLIKLYVWNVCHKFHNTGCSPQVFSDGLTLEMDPLLSTIWISGYYAYEALLWCQSIFFITLVGIFRDFSLFIQHLILIIISETCTQIYWLRGHRLTWEYTENFTKLLENQQETLIITLTMRPTNSKVLEVTEKLSLVCHGQVLSGSGDIFKRTSC